MTQEHPKLLSIPRAAKVIGQAEEDVRAWTRRTVDPLPTVPCGKGTKRITRKVVMSTVDAWLERNSTGRETTCSS